MRKLIAIIIMLAAGVAYAADYPAPVQALIAQGVQVEAEFEAPGGMKGYAARFQGQPMALYLTADGKQVIVGTMLNGDGENLSAEHLANYLPEPDFDAAWPLLEQSAWVREGAADAARIIYVFTDPNCPYCNAFWRATQPYIGENLQVRHILVGVLSQSSFAKAAAILAADDPTAALAKHERNHSSGGIEPLEQVPRKVQQQLTNNVELMRELGAHGTPAIFYKDKEGKVRGVTGMPQEDVLQQEILQVTAN